VSGAREYFRGRIGDYGLRVNVFYKDTTSLNEFPRYNVDVFERGEKWVLCECEGSLIVAVDDHGCF